MHRCCSWLLPKVVVLELAMLFTVVVAFKARGLCAIHLLLERRAVELAAMQRVPASVVVYEDG